MTTAWQKDDGLTDVTSAFKGFSAPLSELVDDIHRRGWTVAKIHIKDGQYVAVGKSPHKETMEAAGRTDATAAANLLIKIMRREFMRGSSVRAKLGAWDAQPIEQQFDQIAQAYASAPVYEPKAAPAWMDLAQDFARRCQIIRMQLSVEYTDDPVPYETADEMREDVTKKRHVFVTRAFAHHPVWSEQQVLDYRLVVDVLGHTIGGADWGWHGTCLAFAQLAPLLNDASQKALYTELLGQAAFGTFYRNWGPQKICFLEDLVEKLQTKENGAGHAPVHPSQSIVPIAMPGVFSSRLSTPEVDNHDGMAPLDPNADWESGVSPLPDNAYLWQRPEGVDPLGIQDATDSLRELETGVSRMHPAMARQTVVNALRGSLMGSRNNAMGHAMHYQALMGIPADVDDPIAYWDALEQRREQHNQARGYAPGSHKQFWPEEQKLKQWVKAANPGLDDGEVHRVAQRELLHILTEEEERVLAQDQGEQLPAEVIQHEAYEALKRRLGGLTKPNLDQKVDFGEDHLWHEASSQWWPSETVGMVPVSRLWPMAEYNRSPVEPSDPNAHPMWSPITDEAEYEARKHDIAQNGIREPLEISYSPRGGYGYVYDGNHRLSIARDLGLSHVPAVVSVRAPQEEIDDEYASGRQPLSPPEPISYEGDGETDHFVHPSAVGLPVSRPKTSTHHADMYPPYLASRMRPLAQLSRHADELSNAAREDLQEHRGHGHHFRAKVLSLGIPGLGPRQVSNAWLHLAPQTSQLGVIEPQVAETLGHDYATDMSNREYFKHERELAAGRDAAGYTHVPLGPFSAAMYDLKAGGPGWHPDRTGVKAYAPTAHSSIDWMSQSPTYPDWGDPYWWKSTQEARDQAAQDFDRTIGVNHPRDEVPFRTSMVWNDQGEIEPVYQLKPGETAYTGQAPWLTHPGTGERVSGLPGTSLMQHVMTTMGHQDPREVWAQDYEVGKDAGAPGIIAKVAMAERSGWPELDQAIDEFMATEFKSEETTVTDLNEYRDPQGAFGQCEVVANSLAAFLKARGFNAYATSDEVGAFDGYQNAQDSAAIGAGDFSYPEHAVVTVYGQPGKGVLNTTIDFTASQYGFVEFPKVHGPGAGWS